MFVYQNNKHEICVSFYTNAPVETPDYVVAINADEKTISVNGTEIENPNAPVDDVDDVEEDVVDPTPAAVEPADEDPVDTTTESTDEE